MKCQLRDCIENYEFADQQEEILFFKYYKPLFYQEPIYYSELAYLESARPLDDKESIKAFNPLSIDQYQDVFGRNHLLFIYHHLERKDLDHQFF